MAQIAESFEVSSDSVRTRDLTSGSPLDATKERDGLRDSTGSDLAALEKAQESTAPGDDALKIVSGEIRWVTEEENKAVLRKIDRHIMPVLFVIYFLQFMDKTTLALSSVFGIVHDTHLEGDQYSLLGSITAIAQMVLQPLSAYFLVRLPLPIYMPCLLGAFETSTQAAFILVGQMWYKRQEQGIRLAIWYSNVGWVNIFGSLIMYGFGHVQSGPVQSYNLAFLVLGIITAAIGIGAFFVFPDNPVRCKFLTPEEKVIAVERLRSNQQGLETKVFKFKQVLETLLDLKSWCWMGLMLLYAIPNAAITVFGPMIIRGFGYDGYEVMLFLMPYGALQVICVLVAFWLSNKYRLKLPVALLFLALCIVGTVILFTQGRSKENQPALLFAYYLLSASTAVAPTFLSWQAVNVAGHTKKTSTTALTIMGSYTGGIVGPLLFEPKDGPYYHDGILACIICYSAAAVLSCITGLYLHYLNKRNEERRVKAGKAAKIVDYSMMDFNEGDGQAQAQANVGKRAFEDLTDLQNDEFIYVL
ncbi:allantoate permease [Coprinopsis cinerea okayama7|uniref:Allantoate permease n=1 Tax=Coprinopsis cinerea (strain Okayama-7 / 130 / ATCC MYA-4618 / FGSC 9003) TaxID=240176 RepID=A8NV87_COPC7|nr:allantoate permease [Coprinopsis cinerea okayama7\|eukprot:XP_001836625.2 allantoate permease [Coprinopsis cinerea okayama7\